MREERLLTVDRGPIYHNNVSWTRFAFICRACHLRHIFSRFDPLREWCILTMLEIAALYRMTNRYARRCVGSCTFIVGVLSMARSWWPFGHGGMEQVILFVKPLEDGVLVLRGVSMEVFSLVTLCRVDKWGRGVSVR